MRSGRKLVALGSNSLAEVAMSFVIFCVLLLIVAFALAAVLIFVVVALFIGSSATAEVFLATAFGVWALLVVLLWTWIVRRLRRASEVEVSTVDFLKFQISSALCVLAFWVLFRVLSFEPRDLLDHLGTVLNVLLLLFSAAYLSFAWASRHPVSTKSYAGVCLAIAVVIFSMLV